MPPETTYSDGKNSRHRPPPDAFVMIIGAMKAGTTTLFNALTQHPRVCPPAVKEPDYFAEPVSRDDAGAAREPVAAYEDLYAFDPDRHDVCLEASTSYTKFPSVMGVPERIAAYGLSPRFIYVVRNPFDRIESHFNHAYRRDQKWVASEILNPHGMLVSMYYTQLREYFRCYPDMDRYRIVDFDDLTARPEVLVQQLYEWMGLEPFRSRSIEASNVTPSRSKIEVRLHRSGLGWARDLVPSSLRPIVKQVVRRLNGSGKRSLTEEERDFIHHWLANDMRRFKEHLGFPVEKWGF